MSHNGVRTLTVQYSTYNTVQYSTLSTHIQYSAYCTVHACTLACYSTKFSIGDTLRWNTLLEHGLSMLAWDARSTVEHVYV
jgi:hypothetical protein